MDMSSGDKTNSTPQSIRDNEQYRDTEQSQDVNTADSDSYLLQNPAEALSNITSQNQVTQQEIDTATRSSIQDYRSRHNSVNNNSNSRNNSASNSKINLQKLRNKNNRNSGDVSAQFSNMSSGLSDISDMSSNISSTVSRANQSSSNNHSSSMVADEIKNFDTSVIKNQRNQNGIDQNNNNNNSTQDSPSRRNSITGGVMAMASLTREKTRFFSPNFKDKRKQVFFHFLKINLVIFLWCLTVLVIFWGATYNTKKYMHNIHILAVVQDDDLSGLPNGIESMNTVLPSLYPKMEGTWHVYNTANFSKTYNANTTDQINAKIVDLIHSERYWMAFNLKPNSTRSLYNSLTNATAPQFNSTNFFQAVYESGRDLIHIKGFIVPIMQAFEAEYQNYYALQYIPRFVSNLNKQSINLNNLAGAGRMVFELYDHRPYYDRILLVVAQIGCIFALLLTVFQFLLFSELNGKLAEVINVRNRVYARLLISVTTHFFTSLFWCTVAAMYQVDFTKAFGRGGFMVFWMSMFLYMWAVGGTNENVLSIIFAACTPYMGFWVLGFILLNIATSFFPFALDNHVYRWGYMMPLHNLLDINKVILLNVSPHKMGRNYGVLVALIALNTAILPFDIKVSRWIILRKARKAAEKKQQH